MMAEAEAMAVLVLLGNWVMLVARGKLALLAAMAALVMLVHRVLLELLET